MRLLRLPTPQRLAADALKWRFDPKVRGLYRLDAMEGGGLALGARQDQQLREPPEGGPTLVLVHGTFSSTVGSFGGLWTTLDSRSRSSRGTVGARLLDAYRGRAFGLEHPTLGASPVENALALAEMLAPGTHLHLLTHSRGGLVAEVLAKACALPAKPNLENIGLPEEQSKTLDQLLDTVRKRRISVDRIVRVAGPVEGTLLASGRLDVAMSILRWSFELAQVPVAPELIEFLGEVARERRDPQSLPGLEAQMPDSPLVRWLARDDFEIPGELRIVAGDVEGDSVWGWVKALVGNAFYWQANDLVVETRSMFGGGRRADGRTLAHVEQGGHVSHLAYFRHAATASLIVDALGAEPGASFEIAGAPAQAQAPQQRSRETPSRTRGKRTVAVDSRPTLVLVPSLFGSLLGTSERELWIPARPDTDLMELAWSGRASAITARGLVDELHADLRSRLEATHRVVPFPYDWRAPLAESAERLAVLLNQELAARARTRSPLRVLAHGTGGLLLRLLGTDHSALWMSLCKATDARVVLVGTPHRGWWLPLRVLAGMETLGGLLACGGSAGSGRLLRDLFAGFPGLIATQASLHGEAPDLGTVASWRMLDDRAFHNASSRPLAAWLGVDRLAADVRWGVPDTSHLADAVRLRKRLDDGERAFVQQGKAVLCQVFGDGLATPAGLRAESAGVDFVHAPGDGCVTVASAFLSGAPSWRSPLDHTGLLQDDMAQAAIEDLLLHGTTNRLISASDHASMTAGSGRISMSPPEEATKRGIGRPPLNRLDVLRLDAGRRRSTSRQRAKARLEVQVVHADVRSIRHPIMIGHYRASRLTGSELVLNRMIGGTMAEAMRVTHYPDEPGECQLFCNRGADQTKGLWEPRPPAVIVVGLGAEGSLRQRSLSVTVRQGVLAWAQRVREGAPEQQGPILAATLIASGGAGITPGVSARQIVLGVLEANQLLEEEGWPTVQQLRLVELYLERASEAFRSLQVLMANRPNRFALAPEIDTSAGKLLHPTDSAYRGARYDYVSATSDSALVGNDVIRFEVDSRRARSEETAISTQLPLVRLMVEAACNDESVGPELGKALLRLLVPIEVQATLLGSEELQLSVDGGTAGIPWELLDAGEEGAAGEPWAIRCKLLRQFKTQNHSRDVIDADRDHRALIIGEPRCDPRYGRLPGARREAKRVSELLRKPEAFGPEQVHALIAGKADDSGPTHVQVITALMQEPWRIIHIAGHGVSPEPEGPADERCTRCGGSPRAMGGVVLSDGVFLGPREVRSLPVVPELVFVNCCWLAAGDPADLLRRSSPGRRNHALMAATVAQALIERGVRCVVAAGWAVDDEAALLFAEQFYRSILAGSRFLDAIATARRAAWEHGGTNHTWAAYQAYGDPDWSLERPSDGSEGRALRVDPSSISSELGLMDALRTIEVFAEDAHPTPEPRRRAPAEERRDAQRTARGAGPAPEVDHIDALIEAVELLEQRCTDRWRMRGDVAERFGDAWKALGAWDRAVRWYELAIKAEDGRAGALVPVTRDMLTARLIHEAFEKRMKKPRPADRDRRSAAETDYNSVKNLAENLAKHCEAHRTVDSLTQCGSTYKRLALIAESAPLDRELAKSAIKCMRARYDQAMALARRERPSELVYPALTKLAADLHFALPRNTSLPQAKALIDEIRPLLDARSRTEHFWTLVNRVELDLYDALVRQALEQELPSIRGRFRELRSLFRAKGRWAFVLHQAEFVLKPYAEKPKKGAKRSSRSEAERNAAEVLMSEIADHAGGSTGV